LITPYHLCIFTENEQTWWILSSLKRSYIFHFLLYWSWRCNKWRTSLFSFFRALLSIETDDQCLKCTRCLFFIVHWIIDKILAVMWNNPVQLKPSVLLIKSHQKYSLKGMHLYRKWTDLMDFIFTKKIIYFPFPSLLKLGCTSFFRALLAIETDDQCLKKRSNHQFVTRVPVVFSL
jgi:hypothetical protein